jgi:hypothetical protein
MCIGYVPIKQTPVSKFHNMATKDNKVTEQAFALAFYSLDVHNTRIKSSAISP